MVLGGWKAKVKRMVRGGFEAEAPPPPRARVLWHGRVWYVVASTVRTFLGELVEAAVPTLGEIPKVLGVPDVLWDTTTGEDEMRFSCLSVGICISRLVQMPEEEDSTLLARNLSPLSTSHLARTPCLVENLYSFQSQVSVFTKSKAIQAWFLQRRDGGGFTARARLNNHQKTKGVRNRPIICGFLPQQLSLSLAYRNAHLSETLRRAMSIPCLKCTK